MPDVLQIAGGTVVMAMALGRELEDLIGVDLGGPAGLPGLGLITIGTGGFSWLAVPAAAALIPMLLPGGGQLLGRNMRQDEWAWADRVFRGTLPPPGNIFITNLRSPRDTPLPPGTEATTSST